MADQQINEMVSAYAAGCLDVDNFINFKEYLSTDGELPRSELGELQNVMALLSLTIELEQPPVALKASVAKKLISLKSEIKAKLKAEKETVGTDLTQSKSDNRITSIKNDKPKLDVIKDLETDEMIKQSKDDSASDKTPSQEIITKKDLSKNLDLKSDKKSSKFSDLDQSKISSEEKKVKYYAEDVESKNKTAKQSRVGYLVSITSIMLIIICAFFIYNNNNNTKQQISEINLVLKETQAKASEAENFIKEHKKLLEFFSYNNIAIVNFDKPDSFSNASGKLFISFDKTLGLLMINNLPELISGEMYQLWLVSRGRSYPVISFIPKKNFNYIHISELPFIKKSEIDLFRITSEKKPNPDLPEGETILVGGFLK